MSMRAAFINSTAFENLKYRSEFEGSIREFYEKELEPFLALDCLYDNCVDLSSNKIGGDDNAH